MPIDDLTALGDALRAARKEKNLTQEQLADESHVSTKQIADIEKARRNPSYLILKALAKVVHLSLDSLMYSDLSPDEAGQAPFSAAGRSGHSTDGPGALWHG